MPHFPVVETTTCSFFGNDLVTMIQKPEPLKPLDEKPSSFKPEGLAVF